VPGAPGAPVGAIPGTDVALGAVTPVVVAVGAVPGDGLIGKRLDG